jgi:hypothetical protein
LKKRTKKLLTFVEPGGAEGYRCTLMAFAFFLSADRLNMVFLLLFFKKEDLSSFCSSPHDTPIG